MILTNPTGGDIWGAELSYRFVVPSGFEDSYVRLENSPPISKIDVGNSEDKSQGDYLVGLAVPIPPSEAAVLVTWRFVFTEEFPMDIYLGPASPQSIEDGFPAYFDADSLRAMGSSSGSFDLPVATVNGGVSGVPEPDLPSLVVLEQCRPNPFNPRTTIRYSIAQEGRVILSVHDLSGQLVRVLVDGKVVGAGGHEAVWDGLDSSGREAASGIYFCRIEALEVSETRRMTLVR